MFICVYECPSCGSIVLESDEARRSSSYEVYCPMCEDSNGNDVRMGLAQTGNPDELETLCRNLEIGLSNLKNEASYAGPKARYRVHGCIDHGDGIEGLVENDRAEFWGVYKVLADDTDEWVADFKGHDDAQMFALAKGKEDVAVHVKPEELINEGGETV